MADEAEDPVLKKMNESRKVITDTLVAFATGTFMKDQLDPGGAGAGFIHRLAMEFALAAAGQACNDLGLKYNECGAMSGMASGIDTVVNSGDGAPEAKAARLAHLAQHLEILTGEKYGQQFAVSPDKIAQALGLPPGTEISGVQLMNADQLPKTPAKEEKKKPDLKAIPGGKKDDDPKKLH